jgi:hypothetical protein
LNLSEPGPPGSTRGARPRFYTDAAVDSFANATATSISATSR